VNDANWAASGGGDDDHCRRRSSSYDNGSGSDWKRQVAPAAASPRTGRVIQLPGKAAARRGVRVVSEQRPEVKRGETRMETRTHLLRKKLALF